jgi:hypothetical protein
MNHSPDRNCVFKLWSVLTKVAFERILFTNKKTSIFILKTLLSNSKCTKIFVECE